MQIISIKISVIRVIDYKHSKLLQIKKKILKDCLPGWPLTINLAIITLIWFNFK